MEYMFKKVGISLMLAACVIGFFETVYAKSPAAINSNNREGHGVKQLANVNREEIKKFMMEQNGFDEYRAERMSNAIEIVDIKFQPLIDSYVKSSFGDYAVWGAEDYFPGAIPEANSLNIVIGDN